MEEKEKGIQKLKDSLRNEIKTNQMMVQANLKLKKQIAKMNSKMTKIFSANIILKNKICQITNTVGEDSPANLTLQSNSPKLEWAGNK